MNDLKMLKMVLKSLKRELKDIEKSYNRNVDKYTKQMRDVEEKILLLKDGKSPTPPHHGMAVCSQAGIFTPEKIIKDK